jgi:2-methylaconitate cis-trans-isomerase PrpF
VNLDGYNCIIHLGVFALDEGICNQPKSLEGSTVTIRSFNTNTDKLINTTFPVSVVDDKCTPLLDLGQTSVAGVPGKASKIILEFLSPGGARTGKLLPTGNATDIIHIATGDKTPQLRLSLVDATNPTVFIVMSDLLDFLSLPDTSSIDFSLPDILNTLEIIRQQGAKLMSLDPSAQAQPKLTILNPPSLSNPDVDIFVHALSMGVLHKAVPMTVVLCLGVAARLKGTLAWEILERSRASRIKDAADLITIGHPSGRVDVGTEFEENGDAKSVKGQGGG